MTAENKSMIQVEISPELSENIEKHKKAHSDLELSIFIIGALLAANLLLTAGLYISAWANAFN